MLDAIVRQPAMDKDTKCEAQLEEVLWVIGVEQELVLARICVRDIIIWLGTRHRMKLRWWECADISLRKAFDSLRYGLSFFGLKIRKD